jgi:hypothetical protein
MKPKVHCDVHKSKTSVPILNHINAVRIFQAHLLINNFIISHIFTPLSSKWFLSLSFRRKIFYAILSSPTLPYQSEGHALMAWTLRPWVRIPLKAWMFFLAIHHHSLVILSSTLYSLATKKHRKINYRTIQIPFCTEYLILLGTLIRNWIWVLCMALSDVVSKINLYNFMKTTD